MTTDGLVGRYAAARATITNTDIGALWADMGPRERRVLTEFAVRLLAGQRAYGQLTQNKKNWRKEAKEEALDMAVYLCAALEDDKESDLDSK